MKTMKKLIRNLSFTKNELQIILFTVTVLTSGLAVKYYKQVISGNAGEHYDYSKSDSLFSALSGKITDKEFKASGKKAGENDTSADYNLQKEMIQSADLSVKESASKDKVNLRKNLSDIININTASKEELIALPGIGESTAEKIIIFREERNGFRKPDELMEVKGIGKRKFESIKDFIKTE
jgi:competence protein ComEA